MFGSIASPSHMVFSASSRPKARSIGTGPSNISNDSFAPTSSLISKIGLDSAAAPVTAIPESSVDLCHEESFDLIRQIGSTPATSNIDSNSLKVSMSTTRANMRSGYSIRKNTDAPLLTALQKGRAPMKSIRKSNSSKDIPLTSGLWRQRVDTSTPDSNIQSSVTNGVINGNESSKLHFSSRIAKELHDSAISKAQKLYSNKIPEKNGKESVIFPQVKVDKTVDSANTRERQLLLELEYNMSLAQQREFELQRERRHVERLEGKLHQLYSRKYENNDGAHDRNYGNDNNYSSRDGNNNKNSSKSSDMDEYNPVVLIGSDVGAERSDNTILASNGQFPLLVTPLMKYSNESNINLPTGHVVVSLKQLEEVSEECWRQRQNSTCDSVSIIACLNELIVVLNECMSNLSIEVLNENEETPLDEKLLSLRDRLPASAQSFVDIFRRLTNHIKLNSPTEFHSLKLQNNASVVQNDLTSNQALVRELRLRRRIDVDTAVRDTISHDSVNKSSIDLFEVEMRSMASNGSVVAAVSVGRCLDITSSSTSSILLAHTVYNDCKLFSQELSSMTHKFYQCEQLLHQQRIVSKVLQLLERNSIIDKLKSFNLWRVFMKSKVSKNDDLSVEKIYEINQMLAHDNAKFKRKLTVLSAQTRQWGRLLIRDGCEWRWWGVAIQCKALAFHRWLSNASASKRRRANRILFTAKNDSTDDDVYDSDDEYDIADIYDGENSVLQSFALRGYILQKAHIRSMKAAAWSCWRLFIELQKIELSGGFHINMSDHSNDDRDQQALAEAEEEYRIQEKQREEQRLSEMDDAVNIDIKNEKLKPSEEYSYNWYVNQKSWSVLSLQEHEVVLRKVCEQEKAELEEAEYQLKIVQEWVDGSKGPLSNQQFSVAMSAANQLGDQIAVYSSRVASICSILVDIVKWRDEIALLFNDPSDIDKIRKKAQLLYNSRLRAGGSDGFNHRCEEDDYH